MASSTRRLALLAGHFGPPRMSTTETHGDVTPTRAAACSSTLPPVVDGMGNVWAAAEMLPWPPWTRRARAALTVTPDRSGLSSTSQAAVTLHLPAGTGSLTGLAVDVAGFVWATDGTTLHRVDPRDNGSMIQVEKGLPAGPITDLRRHPSGYAAATVDGVDYVATNDYAKPAPTTPTPASAWKEVARLPCGNHDIAATVLGDFMYISGGLAPGGFPNQYRVFDEVWACTLAPS